MPSLVLIVPGNLGTRTGGYDYDRRLMAGLRERNWAVQVHELDPSFPNPTRAALGQAAQVLAAIPDGTATLVDGLALGAMPDEVEREAARLRLIALVHHPLALETGLDPASAARLDAGERRALAAACQVIVTSRATAATLVRSGIDRGRISIVEPGTDRAPLATGSKGADLQLLCVGSIVPRKGHSVLFDAMAAIPHRNWRLTCVGSLDRSPATVEMLRARLHTLALESRILLTGEVDATTLAGHYDRADLFVLATWYEGYGMAVSEALARGLPVISTPTGAIPDLVADDAGRLVPAGDSEALAAVLREVIGDAQLRGQLAGGARQVRDRLHRWDDACSGMAGVVEAISNGRFRS